MIGREGLDLCVRLCGEVGYVAAKLSRVDYDICYYSVLCHTHSCRTGKDNI